VTKNDIVRQIAQEMQIEQVLVKQVVQRCLDTIIETVANHGRLELRNFGVFQVKKRAARKARNPRTNQEVHVPSKHVLIFRAGKNVTKRVQSFSQSI